ncbi:MAG: hypothetical protein ACRBCS_08910 [Cellvibrionaceae bacterium]
MAIVIVGLYYLVTYLMNSFSSDEVTQKKIIQQITVLTPPPPPPPPPPEEINEPEVEEESIEEEIEDAPPEEGPEESISEDLGLDTDGTAGSDSFGLIAKKGGKGLVGGGYGSVIKAEINKAMLQDKEIRSLDYKAKITLWVEDDGTFSRYEILMIEGSKDTKTKLEKFFSRLGRVGKPKPFEETSSWFTFKINSVL